MSVTTFETHPDRYRHWQLELGSGDRADIALLRMNVQEDGGGDPHSNEPCEYELKLNSYDAFVDIELADAVSRLRFEHPEIKTVVLTSARDRIFCAGANIFMLGRSKHAFKVNFCKFTNETRLSIEDASAHSGQKYIAACNGVASGGGYELALACDEILLVDDRSSVVSLPEVPLLGVLPGTGGLTRVTDKRKVRRDLADHFSSLAEGVRGKRAVQWGLIDATYKLSKFDGKVAEHARKMADGVPDRASDRVPEQMRRGGVALTPLRVEIGAGGNRKYRWVSLDVDRDTRVARLTVRAPEVIGPASAAEVRDAGAKWWPFAAFREFDDALLHLRFNFTDIGTVVIRAEGDIDVVLGIDHVIEDLHDDWFVSEVRHFIRRTLKRLDYTAKSFIALVDEGTAFAGTLLELALAADRSFMLDDPDAGVQLAVSPMNGGAYPMGHDMTRLQARFYGAPEHVGRVMETVGQRHSTRDADALGLITFAPDDIDWDDEVRVAIEERASLSPDALTGMEANLRFPGPETMETRIFGRLSAWQNWIFQRPNAVGEHGALASFGQPTQAKFDWQRT